MHKNPTKPNTDSMTDIELVMVYINYTQDPSFDITDRDELISRIRSDITFAV